MAKKKPRHLGLAKEVFGTLSFCSLGDSFLKKFGRRRVAEDKTILEYRDLSRPMENAAIMGIWQPQRVTLGALFHNLKHNRRFNKSGGMNIFYVADQAVAVSLECGWWKITTFPRKDTQRWLGTGRVFSGEFGPSLI